VWRVPGRRPAARTPAPIYRAAVHTASPPGAVVPDRWCAVAREVASRCTAASHIGIGGIGTRRARPRGGTTRV